LLRKAELSELEGSGKDAWEICATPRLKMLRGLYDGRGQGLQAWHMQPSPIKVHSHSVASYSVALHSSIRLFALCRTYRHFAFCRAISPTFTSSAKFFGCFPSNASPPHSRHIQWEVLPYPSSFPSCRQCIATPSLVALACLHTNSNGQQPDVSDVPMEIALV